MCPPGHQPYKTENASLDAWFWGKLRDWKKRPVQLKDDDEEVMAADIACQLNGQLVAGSCQCRPAWTGTNCSRLVLQPATKAFELPGMVAWGAAPIQDEATGVWHLFVAVYKGDLGNWNPNSHVVHARASKPQGPYTLVDSVVGKYHCSPAILRTKDGYVLYSSGSNWNGTSEDPPARYGHNASVGSGTLVLSTASSLDGPWVTTMHPNAFGGMGAAGNPSVIELPSGQFALLGDSHSSNGGAFVGPTPAGPFKATNPTCKGLPLTCGSCSEGGSWVLTRNPHEDRYYQEDHRLYQDRAGNFHVFCHAMSLLNDSSSCHACNSGPG